jgi:hypothetical protein
VIGLGHRRQSGKDTAAKALQQYLNVNKNLKVKIESMATKLKEVATYLFSYAGMKAPRFYDQNRKLRSENLSIGKSPREIWISIGMAMRDIDPNVWVENVFHHNHNCDVLIIPDIRFHNEAEAVKKNGVLIKVTRPGVTQYDDVADSCLADYSDWDEEIVNDSTIKELSNKIIAIWEKHYPGV